MKFIFSQRQRGNHMKFIFSERQRGLKFKRPFTNMQNSKPGTHHVVAYEVSAFLARFPVSVKSWKCRSCPRPSFEDVSACGRRRSSSQAEKASGSQGSTKLGNVQNFHCFSRRSGCTLAYFELFDFFEKAKRDGTFITILENCSPKDSFG